jgi:hypothetical protein
MPSKFRVDGKRQTKRTASETAAHAIIPGNTHRPEYPNWSTRRAAGQGCSRQGCVGGHEIIRNKKRTGERDHTTQLTRTEFPLVRGYFGQHTQNLLRGLAAWHSSQNPAKTQEPQKRGNFPTAPPYVTVSSKFSHPPRIILPSNDRAPQVTPLP